MKNFFWKDCIWKKWVMFWYKISYVYNCDCPGFISEVKQYAMFNILQPKKTDDLKVFWYNKV